MSERIENQADELEAMFAGGSKYSNLKKLWTDTWMILLDINVDDIIEHNRFGVGKVVSSLGTGEKKRVDVLFADGTKKRLIVKYANLTKLF